MSELFEARSPLPQLMPEPTTNPKTTSNLAVWGFVMVWVFQPVGFALSLAAWIRDRKDPTKNTGLALAGWVIPTVFWALIWMFVIVTAIIGASADPTLTTPVQ